MTQRNQYDGETPELSDLLRMAAEGVQANFFSCLPAKIVSYDSTKQCADVQPVIKVFDANGEAVGMPVIPCCPVVFPAGGGFSFVFPLAAGDLCLVVFSSRSVAQWVVAGDEQADPESGRVGSLSDGFVIPGVRPQNQALQAAQGNVLSLGLDDGTSTIEVDNAGLVTVAQTLHVGNATAAAANDTLLQAELTKIAASLASVPAPTPYVPAATGLTNVKGD